MPVRIPKDRFLVSLATVVVDGPVVAVVGPVDPLAAVTLADFLAMAHLAVDFPADLLDLLALLVLGLLAVLAIPTLVLMVFSCADNVEDQRRLATIIAPTAPLNSLHSPLHTLVVHP